MLFVSFQSQHEDGEDLGIKNRRQYFSVQYCERASYKTKVCATRLDDLITMVTTCGSRLTGRIPIHIRALALLNTIR